MNISEKQKRIVSLFFVILMIVTAIPINIFAEVSIPIVSQEEVDKGIEENKAILQPLIDLINGAKGSGTVIMETDNEAGTITVDIKTTSGVKRQEGTYYEVRNIVNRLAGIISSENIENDLSIELEKKEEEILDELLKEYRKDGRLSEIDIERTIGASGETHVISIVIGNVQLASKEYNPVSDHLGSIMADLMIEALLQIERNSHNLTEDELVTIIDTIVKEQSKYEDTEVTWRITENNNGRITVEFTGLNGVKTYRVFTLDMTDSSIEEVIKDAFAFILGKLNRAFSDIAGEYGLNPIFGPDTIRQIKPTGFNAGGRPSGWVNDGKKELKFKLLTVPAAKDSNGDEIVVPIYGEPFGAARGTYRYLGYDPRGYPITNPWFPNDKTGNNKFWARTKFEYPWRNKGLATIMQRSRYRVSLVQIPGVDGNKEVRPQIWKGLQEIWGNYINDPAEQEKEWENNLKFQVPATDETWGLAYFPSKLSDGSFWYATIPIVKKSMLGIDLQTTTIVPTPQVVTGRKGKYPYSNFKC